MRRKTTRVAGVLIATVMATGIFISTPVFAGTTQSDLTRENEERIDTAFTGKTLSNNDLAFAVLNTVAEKTGTYDATDGRNTYKAKVDYRLYFNEYRQGTSGDKHAFALGFVAYRITPSGGRTTDVTKWPFPNVENNYTNAKLKSIVAGIVEEGLYFDDFGYYCNNAGNTPTILDDAKEGILTFRHGLDLIGEEGDRPFEVYETDGNGTYHNCYLRIKDVVGKPGDKLEVETYHFFTNLSGSRASLNYVPYSSVANADRANAVDGIVKLSGYIYIPYEVTYDKNGATGTTPTLPSGEYLTCDHNTVTVPVKGDLARGDAKLLGWSEEEITDVITDSSNIPDDLVEPGGTYTISKNKRSDITLHAVWGDKNLGVNEVKVPLNKRLLQSTEGTLPEMTFDFTFEQKSQWEGVNYVSAQAPIAKKSITISSQSDKLLSDDYIGDLTGKTLYEGRIENIFSGFTAPQEGKYCYLVSEKESNPKEPNVTYASTEYVLKFEADANGNVVAGTPRITLYRDGSGKTKEEYTTVPAVFGEKQELIFYNTYEDKGTTPTGIVTNVTPFIVVGCAGVGALVLYATIKGRRNRNDA